MNQKELAKRHSRGKRSRKILGVTSGPAERFEDAEEEKGREPEWSSESSASEGVGDSFMSGSDSDWRSQAESSLV